MACAVNTTQSLPFRFPPLNKLITELTRPENADACKEFIVRMALNKTHSIPGLRHDTAFQIFNQGHSSFEWPLNPVGPWTHYETALVFGRLIDYKLFLLQLVSQLPRPQTSLGVWGQSFAVLHLVADPINPLSGYLTTLVECRRILRETERLLICNKAAARPRKSPDKTTDEVDRQTKVISLVCIAYKTNGHEKKLWYLIQFVHPTPIHPTRPPSNSFPTRAEETHPQAFAAAAAALSRDRSSTFLPVVTAIVGMCLSVMCKYIFLDRNDVDEASPQHIDIWSLSSSLVMVHIVPNVLLASVVGVQQSAYTAQGILGALEERVAPERVEGGVKLVDEKLKEWQDRLVRLEGEAREAVIREIVGFNREEWVREKKQPPEWQGRLETTWHPENEGERLALKNAQVTEGAIPSFRPYRLGQPVEFWKGWTRYIIAAFLTPSWIRILAVVIVSVTSIGATFLALKVPPEGMNCRAFIKLLMVGTYWVKFLVQMGVNHLPDRVMGRVSRGLEAMRWHRAAEQPPIVIKMMVTALFDSFALVFFAAIILTAQWGNLNRPGCYCQTGIGGLKAVFSPQDTWPIVQERMGTIYPGILFGLLGGIVLGVCPLLVLSFRDFKKTSFCRMKRRGRRGSGMRFWIGRVKSPGIRGLGSNQLRIKLRGNTDRGGINRDHGDTNRSGWSGEDQGDDVGDSGGPRTSSGTEPLIGSLS